MREAYDKHDVDDEELEQVLVDHVVDHHHRRTNHPETSERVTAKRFIQNKLFFHSIKEIHITDSELKEMSKPLYPSHCYCL